MKYKTVYRMIFENRKDFLRAKRLLSKHQFTIEKMKSKKKVKPKSRWGRIW
jgi:hypothetical protein